MPFLFVGIIGLGFLFTFYDVFDINVSFIQSCVALKPGCTPATALSAIRVPIALNLAGYVIGTLLLSPLSDRIGRRNMLLVTMMLTGIASLWNALAPDYTNFVLARVLTGVAIGADLSIVNTYVGEVAPRRDRAKWTSVIFVNSALGALLGIWLGLFLTTSSAPWPHGLPFAQAGPGFDNGWRWMYAVGALLALVAIVLRVELPESPRWLVGKGRVEEADRVVSKMEERAAHARAPARQSRRRARRRRARRRLHVVSARAGNPVYRRRVLVLTAVWFFAYVTVFAISAGGTSLLTALKYPPSEAGRDPGRRRLRLPRLRPVRGQVRRAAGAQAVAADRRDHHRDRQHPGRRGRHQQPLVAFIGMGIVFFGFNVWVPMTYALSAESFPTRARATGFGLVDGLGHLGGGIGVLLIAPQIPHMSVLGAFLVVSRVPRRGRGDRAVRGQDARPALRGAVPVNRR